MCRLFAAVSNRPVDVTFELLEAENSVLRQSEDHDSGWGIAQYPSGQLEPEVRRFPIAAYKDSEFAVIKPGTARMLMVHVRRATLGGLSEPNTHPFTHGRYSFCHNGTIAGAAALERLSELEPRGDTDSERYFDLLMTQLDPSDVVGSLRRTVRTIVERCEFSALNFLLCDGESVYAYRFGTYTLFCHSRSGDDSELTMLASERLDSRRGWIEVGQDELVVCSITDPGKPRISRLLGDSVDGFEFALIDRTDLTGDERGAWAAERAAADF